MSSEPAQTRQSRDGRTPQLVMIGATPKLLTRSGSGVVLGAGAGGGGGGAGGVAETVGQRNLVGQGGERGEVRLVGEGVEHGYHLVLLGRLRPRGRPPSRLDSFSRCSPARGGARPEVRARVLGMSSPPPPEAAHNASAPQPAAKPPTDDDAPKPEDTPLQQHGGRGRRLNPEQPSGAKSDRADSSERRNRGEFWAAD